MSCGCRGRTWGDEKRTRAVMCQTCFHGERSVIGLASRCRVDGADLEMSHADLACLCPKGHWPDHNDDLRWMGLRWRGVPVPLRVLVEDQVTGPLHGCGCIDRLKRLWERLVALNTGANHA